MAIKLATHFPTLVGNAIYFTQKALTGLSGSDLNKVNKLIFSHYPFTSDLEHIGSITYRLTDGYYTVRYPSTAKELHMFNMSYALYTQIEGNFYFTKSMPTDCLLAPVASQVSDELRNMKLPTYDELETLMSDPSAYVPSDPRYAGVLRSPDPDDLTECNYYLLPVMYGSVKLSEFDLGMGYRVVRSMCFNTPPTICIAILEMYRLAQLLHLEDPVDYKYVLDEWYEVPRYPGYDHGILCPINDDTTLRAPFDPRECALLATHPERREVIVLVKRDADNDLDGSKYGHTVLTSICRDLTTKSTLVQTESSLIQSNLPITSGLTLTATDNHQNSFIRNQRDEALLVQLNVIRQHVNLPPLKGEWGTGGHLIGFKETE